MRSDQTMIISGDFFTATTTTPTEGFRMEIFVTHWDWDWDWGSSSLFGSANKPARATTGAKE